MTVALQRLPDWPEQLAAFVAARESSPFKWGSNDCVIHAADAVQAITGADPLAAHGRTWGDEAGARAALEAMGGLIAAVGLTLGTELRSPRLAQRGDLVLVPGPEGTGALTLAICLGSEWVCPGDEGHYRGPMQFAALAWAVGRQVAP